MKRFIVLIAFLYGFNVNANPDMSELPSLFYSSSIYPIQVSSGLTSLTTGFSSGSSFVSSAAPFVASVDLGLNLLRFPFSIFHKSNKPLEIDSEDDLDTIEY